ncbi:MAG: hypothetical protein LBO00_01090 [Zoogloeaceae bacterium]|nr:hypothetical protein [Zoogloeaceae bacterium]
MLNLVKTLFFLSLAALVFGFCKGDVLPSPSELLPQLKTDPLQTPTFRAPFDVSVKQITYRIKPLYHYELYGLVVSKHEADSFIDQVHKSWGDHLNAADLCVIWGKNALSGAYEQIEFSSGQWTCYAQTKSQEAWESFSEHHISNNHMISERHELLQTLRRARVGDQVHFKGYLAEYSHDNFLRGSSTVRTDSGNGACETVYMESFTILKPGPRRWRIVRWVSALVLLLSVCAWFFMPIGYTAYTEE